MTAAAEQAYAPAARQALAAFGIEASDLRFVYLSENVTFRATEARSGARLVLRLHRPWYHDIAALRSEHLWTRALTQAGIAAPEPLVTPDGQSFVQVEIPAMGEQRWAGLARWVEGELLAEVVAQESDTAVIAGYFAQMGALLAALHNQATAWLPPPGFRRHALDADGLMGPAPFWGPFWDNAAFSPGERTLLLATRDRLHAALTRYGKPARSFSLIHADLHSRNVLIDGPRAAVIDFDDCGFGWHQYDLAVALVGFQDEPGFETLRSACIAGYRAVRPMADADLALLPMFVLVRELAQMGWFHQRPELPPSPVPGRIRERICAKLEDFEPPV